MARRTPSQLNMLLAVDKPVGCTSHDVVSQCRRALHERRVGHAVVLEGGDDALHEAEQAFRIDGETRPDVGLAVARAVLVVAASIDKQCVAQAGKRVRESAEGMDSCPSVHGIPQDPVE